VIVCLTENVRKAVQGKLYGAIVICSEYGVSSFQEDNDSLYSIYLFVCQLVAEIPAVLELSII
jgi:hypothetical protein